MNLLYYISACVFIQFVSSWEWPMLSLLIAQWVGTFCPEAQHFLCKPHTLLWNIPCCTAWALSSDVTRAPCFYLLRILKPPIKPFTIQVYTWGLCYPSHFSGHISCVTFLVSLDACCIWWGAVVVQEAVPGGHLNVMIQSVICLVTDWTEWITTNTDILKLKMPL